MQNELSQLEGERGIPGVGVGRITKGKQVMFGVATAVLVLVMGALAVWQYNQAQGRKQAQAKRAHESTNNQKPTRTFLDLPKVEPVAAAPVAPVLPAPAPELPEAAAAKEKVTPPKPLDKSDSALMFDTGNHANKPGESSPVSLAEHEGYSNSDLGEQLRPTKTNGRKASLLHNRSLLLAKGAIINCVLQTKLVSTVSGMANCLTTRDVFSDDGKVLLIEAGSLLTGEYSAKSLRQGMARIFVMWSRIKTINGVVVNLDSSAVDPLGGAGLPGEIDTHFGERFGAALMLSLIDDVARGLTSSINNGDSGNNQFNFGGGGGNSSVQSMPGEALKYTINIPPTLYKNQGEEVAVYVSRDLDFSDVYSLQLGSLGAKP